MTREEAIEIIEYTFLNADGHLKPLDFDYGGGKGIVEALKMATEALSAPSLPSNLDEVAEEIVKDWLAYGDGEYKKLVIAGIEWMAGQFQKIDGSLDDWYETNGVEYCYGIRANESFEVPEGFYIRKKQPGESLKEKDGI